MNKPSTFQIIMKRFLLVFGCGAILAASVSCTKDTTVAPEVKKGAIEIIASVDGTRTSLEGANVLWSANDALGIFSGTKFVNAQFTTTDDKSASATFTGDATDAEGTEAAKAFSPIILMLQVLRWKERPFPVWRFLPCRRSPRELSLRRSTRWRP